MLSTLSSGAGRAALPQRVPVVIVMRSMRSTVASAGGRPRRYGGKDAAVKSSAPDTPAKPAAAYKPAAAAATSPAAAAPVKKAPAKKAAAKATRDAIDACMSDMTYARLSATRMKAVIDLNEALQGDEALAHFVSLKDGFRALLRVLHTPTCTAAGVAAISSIFTKATRLEAWRTTVIEDPVIMDWLITSRGIICNPFMFEANQDSVATMMSNRDRVACSLRLLSSLAGKARSNQALYENIGEDMSLLWACLGEHMNGSGSAKVAEAAARCYKHLMVGSSPELRQSLATNQAGIKAMSKALGGHRARVRTLLEGAVQVALAAGKAPRSAALAAA